MPKASPILNDFSAGEISPDMLGKVDAERYSKALITCLNQIPIPDGPLLSRPGTKFVAEVKDSSKTTIVVRFKFSVTQAYILEFGDLYIRFYKDNGQIQSGGSPYEIVSTYAEADLRRLRFRQSADTLYITHPSYAPRKLTRTGHTAWTLSTITFLDGPYLPLNTTAITLTPAATTGSGVNLDASASLWTTNDVGRVVRVKHSTTWGWARIASYVSATRVTVDIQSAFGATTASLNWRLGLWYAANYPAVSTFHEDRLCFLGTPSHPQRMDGSNSADYENFAPTDTSGTTAASNAISFNLNADDVNAGRWLSSDEKGLLAGTEGGPWVITPSSQGEAISPTNVNAKRSTALGSADIQAVTSGKATLFAEISKRRIREFTYFYDADGFRAINMTRLAKHILKTGVIDMVFQSSPYPILWCVRTDGVLVGMTYEREPDSLVAAWHRHTIGGTSDAAGNPAKVESVAVIPSTDASKEELWVVVKRYINGSTKRYIEYMTPFFEEETEQQDAFFVDSGLTYDSPLTITGITAANPPVVTIAAHGLSNGDKVLFSEIEGMEELNGVSALVANKTANTFELTDLDGNNIDASDYTTYISGGECRKMVSTITGLTHLEGQTVSVMVDGAAHPTCTVSGGSISLNTPAAVVQVGLGYNRDGKLPRIEAGAADGTALGKTRRVHRLGILVDRSMGFEIGPDFDNLTPVTIRTSADEGGRATELYSGILSEEFEADSDKDNYICWRMSQPLPLTILAFMPQMHTQDRG